MTIGTKLCPKCSKEMGPAEHVLIIPAVNNPPLDPVSTKFGLNVNAFSCPGCNYVELYYKKT